MYSWLLIMHSIMRWFVMVTLTYAVLRAYIGHTRNKKFGRVDNRVRHWTATIAHIQLITGMLLYSQSPLIKYYWNNTAVADQTIEASFFGWMHALLMITGIVLLTIGSLLAKRRQSDADKFRTMLVWYAFALLIIIIAVPWPFSPFVNRPYFR